jgi:O-antigen ligase
MLRHGRAFIAPVYLFACLILGGSAQGIWENMVLELAGIAIIAWSAIAKVDEPVSRPARQLFWLAILLLIILAIQLIPLPGGLWSALGPRREVAKGFAILGMPVPAEPLSLTPALGLSSMFGLIPPLAMICAMVRMKAYRGRWIAIALVAGTTIGIILGALQVAGSSAAIPQWYIYEETNWGRAVGFFANADHMATLLLVTIPFLAALVAAARSSNMQHYSAIVAIVGALGIAVVVGLVLNGSLAGYGLALPVIAGSALIILRRRSPLRRWVLGSAGVLLVLSMIALEVTPIGARAINQHATSAVQSRGEILSVTSHAIAEFMPFGSGLGSFRNVYALYERPEQVSDIYVIHAHNDYAEVALELGLAGLLLIILFFAWWGASVWRVWKTSASGPFARAASIASAAVLIHSLVDFPLRTAAIAACFGMCLALLGDSRAQPPKEGSQLRRTRQVVIR